MQNLKNLTPHKKIVLVILLASIMIIAGKYSPALEKLQPKNQSSGIAGRGNMHNGNNKTEDLAFAQPEIKNGIKIITPAPVPAFSVKRNSTVKIY